MYRVVHYHLMWAVVSAADGVVALLAVEAVRGFDAPFGSDSGLILVSWVVVSGSAAFCPGPVAGSRAEAKRARPLAPGTALPTTRTSLARAGVWGFLGLPVVVGILFGLFVDAGMSLLLACAMVPESLLTTLRLAIRERRTGRVYWCGVTADEESDEEPAKGLDADGGDRAKSRDKGGTRHPLWWSPRPSLATGEVPGPGPELDQSG